MQMLPLLRQNTSQSSETHMILMIYNVCVKTVDVNDYFNAYVDACAHSFNTYAYAHAQVHAYAHAYAYALAYAYASSNAYANAYAHAHACANCHSA